VQYHVNGRLVPADEATVSVRDRGFRYGDAAFETLRAYGGTVFEWAAHRERLEETCAALGMADAVPADCRARVSETLAANDLADAYVRVSVTRGVQPGTLTPDPDVEPTVVVVVKPLPRGGRGGESVWDGPATVATSDVQRVPDAAVPARAKTHNYLNGVLARLDADADEALLCDADGDVAEGATSNVFFVRDGVIHTPSLDGPVLPGVTRAVVGDLADAAGVPVETGAYGPDAFRTADEAFLTNTTWEVRPDDGLDGTPVGGGPVTSRLTAAFDDLVECRHY
jgi:branched-chain amino acid aminotransferase